MSEENPSCARYYTYSFSDFSRPRLQPAKTQEFQIKSSELQPAVFTTFVTHIPHASGRNAFFLLNEHLTRLLQNANKHGLSATRPLQQRPDLLRSLVFECVAEFLSSFRDKVKYARIRLVLSNEKLELFVDSYINPWEKLPGIQVAAIRGERRIPELKTTLIDDSLRLRQLAEQQGCEEGLFIDSDGTLREGAWTNVFWINADQVLCTTASRVLPGVTRALLLSLFDVTLADITLAKLMEGAREVFVTQSTSGVTPVLSISQQLIGDGQPGIRTLAIQKAYRDCIRARAEYLDLE